MKNFREAVKRNQEKHEGLHVFTVSARNALERELIDLIAIDRHGKVTFIRARGNGHGKLQQRTKLSLQALGKKCGAEVLYAKVNGEDEIVFFRIYER